jgi:hypothetical protein
MDDANTRKLEMIVSELKRTNQLLVIIADRLMPTQTVQMTHREFIDSLKEESNKGS